MLRNHPLLSKLKRKLNSNIPRVEGIVKSTEKGFGFLEIDSKTSYFIPFKNMKKVMHGDRITALLKIDNSREIAEPEKLIEPFLTRFIGTIQVNKSIISIIPDHPFFKEKIVCSVSCILPKCVKTGDWAVAVLMQHKLIQGHYKFLAKLVKYIIKKDDVLVPWLVTLSRYQLESDCFKLNSSSIIFDNSLKREDLTHLDFITIDNSSTKDIDDALYVEKQSLGAFNLIVAISDPTSYIPFGSSLDNFALKRSFTNYLPGFTIPMLPSELSENKCSLKVNKSRPVIACKIRIDSDGCILHNYSYFFLAWIKSKATLVYECVSDWLEHKGKWVPECSNIANQLFMLNSIYNIRRNWRKNYAVLFKEHPEYNFKLSSNFQVLNVFMEMRRTAHKIVEEAMIAANICAAKVLSEKLGFGIYNVHIGFDASNSENVVRLLSKYGFNFCKDEIRTLKGFCKLRRILNKHSYKYLDNRIKKYQSFGELQFFPGPHFALGLDAYATWTSPIRKYSDMVNHRLLKSIITHTHVIKPSCDILLKINDRRKRLKMAERDLEDWLYSKFFSSIEYTKNSFNAEIIDVFRSGIRVRSLKNGANIFIPSSFLHNIRNELLCHQDQGIVYINDKKMYSVSDIIQVKLINIRTQTRNLIGKPV
ncbi:exoribonuclease II [Buchnera aphidicola str. Bp (Baizongia pistaciae)]|uniref:Exoribonuclease 2 n=1 Tax=Buchnera aphidicola subsp. Baizongia pistaciae (strain Bp) TaxID=224915 RepID=RNB_BUCBP|nr:exoribonuclease II [Buchnera aphidicola]Q89AM0.1 RecName: Full=Exoribonuclease 2; AltName: Full=Exoribonuclease II; Short=RNase II; Short=Ribonuclease II [Buchnera aphidicola str. Bp (Baizongia pistaciae)]AAO26974.1 exoribonuclease II [Buchnera aphidicola str. Bp (Baizongia pistaciae)]